MLGLTVAALLLTSVVACGPSELEIQEMIDASVAEARIAMRNEQDEMLKEQKALLDSVVETVIERTDERTIEGLRAYQGRIQSVINLTADNFQGIVNTQAEDFQTAIDLTADNFQELIFEQDQEIFDLHQAFADSEERVVEVLNNQTRVIDDQSAMLLEQDEDIEGLAADLETLVGERPTIITAICSIDYWYGVGAFVAIAGLTDYLGGGAEYTPDDVWADMVEGPSYDTYNEHSVACVIEDGSFYLIQRDQ